MVRKIKEEKSEIVKRWCPVKLTEPQILERARTAAQRTKEKVEVEADKAAKMRVYAEKLKELQGDITRLSTVVETGYEYQNVDCEIVKDLQRKKLLCVRLDTGEIVTESKLTDEQLVIDKVISDGKSEDDIDFEEV